MKKTKMRNKIIYHIIVTIFGLIMIYPLVWMIMSSFKDTNTIFTTAGQLIPEEFTLDNYRNGWKGFAGVGFGTFFKNLRTCTLQIQREKNTDRCYATFHDATCTGFDDSSIFMVSKTWMG